MLKLFYSTSSTGGFFSPTAHKKTRFPADIPETWFFVYDPVHFALMPESIPLFPDGSRPAGCQFPGTLIRNYGQCC